MDTTIHLNEFTLREVRASRNPNVDRLVRVEFAEASAGGHTCEVNVAAVESIWQDVVDQLAALGITASHETTPSVPRLAPVSAFRGYEGGAL